MKVERQKEENNVIITFIPETVAEELIMGDLRNHFFFGLPEKYTYPNHADITTENNYVTSIMFRYKEF